MSYVKSIFVRGRAHYHGFLDPGLKEIRPDLKEMKSVSGPVKLTSKAAKIVF